MKAENVDMVHSITQRLAKVAAKLNKGFKIIKVTYESSEKFTKICVKNE